MKLLETGVQTLVRIFGKQRTEVRTPKNKERDRQYAYPVLMQSDYLVKTLSASSQMVAPKSSTVVAPVNTP